MARFEVVSDESTPESGLGQAVRHGAATLGIIGETLGNLPNTLVGGIKGLQGLTEQAANYITPQPVQNFLNLGQEPLEPLSQGLRNVELPKFGTLAKKAFGSVLPENYLEPQSEPGKKYHEFISDVTSLMAPIGGAMRLGRAAAVAGSGALAKWAAQNVGAGEAGQTGAKMGAMLATSLIGPYGLRNYMSNLYNEADTLVPETAITSSKNVEPILGEIDKIISRGGMTPIKQDMAKRVAEIRNNIDSGQILVHDLLEFKRNVNEWINHYGGIGKLEGLQKKLPKMVSALKSDIKEYGKTNPPFYNKYSEAEDIYQGMIPTIPANKFLQKHVNKENIGKITGGVLLGYIPPTTGAKLVGTGISAREGLRYFDMFKKSKAIRHYYGRVIKDTFKEDSKALSKDIALLDKQISKEFPENVSGSGKESGRYVLLD